MANPTDPVTLDELDQRLVQALQQNARATLTELGQDIHLGTSATRARLNALEVRGVITGHTTHVFPAALGYTLHAVVRMKVRGALYDKIAEVLHRQPQIVRALRITGESCYSLEILATDMADLERVTTDLARIGSITTDLVYEVVTDRPAPVPRQRERED
ncbi:MULTISPECIES: Lrp/AsnC family transcriptional regulator [unclassified Rathayibacter]|uniref:Lrp/AsnC family transcriptional regulator n=1 Tax=unclassified Rathayibacter TaxID=2609250 RepID=UPI00188D469D|nr:MULTISPECIES: Lrp/AsnC family transcriptional regulator [unclassified Rathayibacter]MBF4462613.1 Lrp/AsnC family transcriptional regulator [Rathayibacter sp. VKM Ac-2879]MBF4503344.1 Lrp/AsnC family transcriptional regulator [Rathayibacter sp. VKM Ac-2878]